MSEVRRRFQFGMSSLVLLMTVACVGVGIYLTWASKVDVLVASEDLNYRTEITKANVTFARWPADIVPEGAITSADGIPAGKFITTRLRKGQAVIGEELLGRADIPFINIPPGCKVINIKVPIANGLTGLLCRGDRVDVIVFESDDTEENKKTISKNVGIFNLGSRVGSVFYIVGLLVTEKQAAAILEARAIGQLDVELRN